MQGNFGDSDDHDDAESNGGSTSTIFPPLASKTEPSLEGFNASSRQRSKNSSISIRSRNAVGPMTEKERIKVQMKNFFNRLKKPPIIDDSEVHAPEDPEEGTADVQGKPSKPQYRLETTNVNPFFLDCRGVVGAKELSDIKPNERLASCLHWMFRSNFTVLFSFMCLCFFGLIVLFAGFISAASRLANDDCVRAGGINVTAFTDDFALSWTTFSTVGYGSTYPALTNENDNDDQCLLITLICSMESFLGVLYSGFCGAILFGKILRIQSHAQVIFSDAIIIRYGRGLQEYSEDDDSDSDDGSEDKKILCPVLEFRIVNRLFNEPGGEIMDASINVVANVNARDADPNLVDALNSSGRSKLLRRYSYRRENNSVGSRRFPPINISDSIMSDTQSEASGRISLDSRWSKKSSKGLSSLISRNHRAVDEDPSARLVAKRIFSKMYFEQCEHPFFKRVWVGRHILNGESPLVRPKVKRLIRKNNGYWPKELNDYTSVRQSLLFNQILVSLNGVSNLSAHEVYAQKIYDFVDMNVGYQFVNTLYKDVDGTLKVDTDLINDVREQHGGGGEPLIVDD